jgi:hypothetical protein
LTSFVSFSACFTVKVIGFSHSTGSPASTQALAAA